MMETEQIRQLVDCFARAGLKSLKLREGDFSLELEAGGGTEAARLPAAAEAVPVAAEAEEPGLPVTAPVVGVFYDGPAPGAEPFVKVGQQVRQGQTLCILEAMKMMNEIAAPVSGEVVAIEAAPGELVSFGQTLLRIRQG